MDFIIKSPYNSHVSLPQKFVPILGESKIRYGTQL